MCKRGDIIIIDSYSQDGISIPKHSFVVLDDNGGEIGGLSFDFISLVMSSFKTKEQIKRKLSYPGNFPIGAKERNVDSTYDNGKDGYIKCEQFYYFKKDLISYTIIGSLSEKVLEIIEDYINELIEKQIEFNNITDNL